MNVFMCVCACVYQGFPGDTVVKNLPPMQERRVWSLDKEDALEEEATTYSSILGWRTPRIEELGGQQLCYRARHS